MPAERPPTSPSRPEAKGERRPIHLSILHLLLTSTQRSATLISILRKSRNRSRRSPLRRHRPIPTSSKAKSLPSSPQVVRLHPPTARTPIPCGGPGSSSRNCCDPAQSRVHPPTSLQQLLVPHILFFVFRSRLTSRFRHAGTNRMSFTFALWLERNSHVPLFFFWPCGRATKPFRISHETKEQKNISPNFCYILFNFFF